MKFRKIYNKLLEEFDNHWVLLIVGARQVGKTTLLKQLRNHFKDDTKTYFLNLEDPAIKNSLNTHPNKLFDITGSGPDTKQIIFIDEIQYLLDPTNFLKYIYDEYSDTIKLVVSGSSSFYIDQKFKDSLIGRKRVFHISTLDFEEFLDFREEESIKKSLFTDKKIPILYKTKIESLFLDYIKYGGYPEIVLLKDQESKRERLQDFTREYVKKDIFDSNIADSDKFLNILKVLAAQCGELVNMNEIANTFNMSMPTVEKYMYIMQKSFHIALIRPYYTNNRKELSKMPKVYFYDLGFRNSLLNNFENIDIRGDTGAYFENIVWREFGFKYGWENIKFWRTQAKNEVDFIINEKKAYEVKFNKNQVKPSKYKLFKENYHSFDLEFICFDEIVNWIIKPKI